MDSGRFMLELSERFDDFPNSDRPSDPRFDDIIAAVPNLSTENTLALLNCAASMLAAGFVDTPLSASLLGDGLDKRRDQLRATLPIGRVVGPADVAALAVHLMSNTAITGATYDIDGGQQLVP